jgi:hypothetical protein
VFRRLTVRRRPGNARTWDESQVVEGLHGKDLGGRERNLPPWCRSSVDSVSALALGAQTSFEVHPSAIKPSRCPSILWELRVGKRFDQDACLSHNLSSSLVRRLTSDLILRGQRLGWLPLPSFFLRSSKLPLVWRVRWIVSSSLTPRSRLPLARKKAHSG